MKEEYELQLHTTSASAVAVAEIVKVVNGVRTVVRSVSTTSTTPISLLLFQPIDKKSLLNRLKPDWIKVNLKFVEMGWKLKKQ